MTDDPPTTRHGIHVSAPAILRAPVQAAKDKLAEAETLFRTKFGGFDTSCSTAEQRKRTLQRYHELFQLMDARNRGCVPIDDLEDCFGLAGFFEARTEVGQLAYDADKDGNGALDFDEFTQVLDKLDEYRVEMAGFGRMSDESSFFFGTEGGVLPMREVIFRTFDEPTFSPCARVVSILLSSAILLAVLVFVLQTEPSIEGVGGLFAVLESFCLVVFMADYITRAVTCKNHRVFFLSLSNAIDLLTILPYFLDEVNEAFHPRGFFGPLVQFLRMFRIFRIFRIVKYMPYVHLMTSSAAASVAPLGMALLILMIGVLLLAMGTFYAERGTWDASQKVWINVDDNKSPFQSVGDALYWCIITLTTVGYGDIYPVTPWGKVVGSFCALSGCMIISFPIAIYTDEFGKQYTEFEKKKALQAELGTCNLVLKLMEAKYNELILPDYPRFPAEMDMRSYRSESMPRNIQMMRKLRQLMLHGGTQKAKQDGAATQLHTARRSSVVRRSNSTAGESASKTAEDASLPDVPFSDVWASTTKDPEGKPRQRAWSTGDEYDYTGGVVVGETEHKEAADPAQEAIYERILKRARGESLPILRQNSLPRVRRQLDLPQTTALPPPLEAGSSTHERLAYEQQLFDRLLSVAKNALEARRATVVAQVGRDLQQGVDPWIDMVLKPDSFSYLELSRDAEVERAILELLSDHRKRLWTEIRALEAKFRDDICMEVGRRWQHWMAMPADYVHDVSYGFVFRKKELNAAMRFKREDMPIGLISAQSKLKPSKSMASIFAARASSSSGSLGQNSTAASRPKDFSFDSVFAPMKHAATTELPKFFHQTVEAIGTSVRSNLPAALQPATDMENYQARIASQYADVLGGDIPVTLHSLQRDALKNAGDSSPDTAYDAFHKLVQPVNDKGAGSSQVGMDNTDAYVRTAFGLSVLPRSLPTIDSSLSSGTASISEHAATQIPPPNATTQFDGLHASHQRAGAEFDESTVMFPSSLFDVSAPATPKP